MVLKTMQWEGMVLKTMQWHGWCHHNALPHTHTEQDNVDACQDIHQHVPATYVDGGPTTQTDTLEYNIDYNNEYNTNSALVEYLTALTAVPRTPPPPICIAQFNTHNDNDNDADNDRGTHMRGLVVVQHHHQEEDVDVHGWWQHEDAHGWWQHEDAYGWVVQWGGVDQKQQQPQKQQQQQPGEDSGWSGDGSGGSDSHGKQYTSSTAGVMQWLATVGNVWTRCMEGLWWVLGRGVWRGVGDHRGQQAEQQHAYGGMWLYICVCILVYTCVYTCVLVCIRVSMRVFLCPVLVCTCVYTCTCMDTGQPQAYVPMYTHFPYLITPFRTYAQRCGHGGPSPHRPLPPTPPPPRPTSQRSQPLCCLPPIMYRWGDAMCCCGTRPGCRWVGVGLGMFGGAGG